ncbi:hypothetical protein ACJX0J_024402, partial [Zea mays]
MGIFGKEIFQIEILETKAADAGHEEYGNGRKMTTTTHLQHSTKKVGMTEIHPAVY